VALAELAAQQWGIVGVAELRSLGFDRGAVHRRVRSGRLHPLYRGVYVLGHKHLGVQGRRLAAVRAMGGGALLSHRTAADAWGLRAYNGARIDVLVASGARRKLEGVLIHQTRSLHPDDITELDGIPITSVARTILDSAATATAHVVEQMVHEAEVHRVLDVAEIQAALDRRPNAKNATYVRAAITTPSPGPTRSELEDRFHSFVHRHRLNRPIRNALVPTRIGVLEVDALWPDINLVVELDGAATHLTRKAFEEDRRRDAALVAAGYIPMRISWLRLTTDEQGLLDDLAATRSHLRPAA
jgi:very-short-patch-repair endonuclease